MKTALNILKYVTMIGLPVIILFLMFNKVFATIHPANNTNTIPEDTFAAPQTTKTVLRDSIVDFSMSLLGTRYISGACSKDGFDCSGFVYYVFRHFKIQVPRSSSEYKHYGKEIPIENVKKGDILVFLSPTRNEIGHVGIVTNPKGRDSDFIHSSSGKEMKVIITSLKNEGYTKRFVKAVDVL
jgi:cell wall-associated NlpC family hydrolase